MKPLLLSGASCIWDNPHCCRHQQCGPPHCCWVLHGVDVPRFICCVNTCFQLQEVRDSVSTDIHIQVLCEQKFSFLMGKYPGDVSHVGGCVWLHKRVPSHFPKRWSHLPFPPAALSSSCSTSLPTLGRVFFFFNSTCFSRYCRYVPFWSSWFSFTSCLRCWLAFQVLIWHPFNFFFLSEVSISIFCLFHYWVVGVLILVLSILHHFWSCFRYWRVLSLGIEFRVNGVFSHCSHSVLLYSGSFVSDKSLSFWTVIL